MSIINYWVAVDETIHQDIMDYYDDPDNYAGSTPEAHIVELTKGLHDPKAAINLFKPYNGQRLYSTYVSTREVYDMLLDAYPTTLELGAWNLDGSRVNSLHPDLINFMPDVFVIDDAETFEGHFELAQELKDINLLFGQSSREFS